MLEEFEWDEAKRIANIKRHAIDFIDAIAIFNGQFDLVTTEDLRFDYDERRFVSLGMLRNGVIVVIHTERGQMTRIISARKATKNEQIRYFKTIYD